MKKILLPSLFASMLLAGEQNFIELDLGIMNSKDHFSTNSDAKLDSLDSSASSETEAVPFISFYYGHELDKENSLFTQMSDGEFNLGYSRLTDVGLFDVGFVYMMPDEAWENPFETTKKREKTDVDEMGAFIGYGLEWDDGFETYLKYQFTNVDFEKETVADALKREGERHTFSVENNIGPYMANVHFEQYKADGKQSAYDRYDVEFGRVFKINHKMSLRAFASLGYKEYDQENSVLNKKIDATIYSGVASLNYEEPFDYENSYVALTLGSEHENANHNFYDKENNFAFFSIGYRF